MTGSAGQLSHSINLGGTTRTLAYRHDRGGNRTRITHPDGMAFDYTWDGRGRPTYLRSTRPAANALLTTVAPMVMSRLRRHRGAGTTIAAFDYRPDRPARSACPTSPAPGQ